MAPRGRVARASPCGDRAPREEPRPALPQAGRGAGGGTRGRPARRAGPAPLPRAAGPGCERRLGGHGRSGRSPPGAQGGDRRRRHDLASRLRAPRRLLRPPLHRGALGGRPPRLHRLAPTPPTPDPRRGCPRTPRRPPRGRRGRGLRRHRGRDADAGAAAASPGDRQRVRLRGLRGARVPARRAPARHPCRQLLRAARPAGVPRRAGAHGRRRGRPLRRRLPHRLPRLRGPARPRRPRRGRLPPLQGRGARTPAGLGRPSAAHPRQPGPRPRRALREGLRVPRRGAPDPRRRAARRGGGRPHPRHRRRHGRRPRRRRRDGGGAHPARRAAGAPGPCARRRWLPSGARSSPVEHGHASTPTCSRPWSDEIRARRRPRAAALGLHDHARPPALAGRRERRLSLGPDRGRVPGALPRPSPRRPRQERPAHRASSWSLSSRS